MKLTFFSLIIQYLLTFACGFYNENHSTDVIVNTTNGFVRGKISKIFRENKYYASFKGIPYAKPPINELRFKPPIESENWTRILNAYDFGSKCTQRIKNAGIIGNEDCLFLNIFTPNASAYVNMPVMVCIHGGAYKSGSGNDELHGPDFLVNNSVILVTLNYRIGPFGFLSLGTNEYPGNMALKDQQLALKWVYQNINNFGGNRDLITLVGYSSGATCVEFHIQSNESRKYFGRAICSGGSMLGSGGVIPITTFLPGIIELAGQKTNQHNLTYNELVTFIRNVNASELLAEPPHCYLPGMGNNERFLHWSPIIEDINNPNAFLVEHPEKVILKNTKNDIEAMYGLAEKESIIGTSKEITNPKLLEPLDENFQFVFPIQSVTLDYQSKDFKNMASEVKKYYFGEYGHVDNSTMDKYIEFMSDAYFQFNIIRSVNSQVRRSSGKTYVYRFAVDGKLNYFKLREKLAIKGAGHGDEICYAFKCNDMARIINYDNLADDSMELNMVRTVTKLFTNFAKYGNPKININGEDFRPFTTDYQKILDIRNNGLNIQANPYQKTMQFWNNIYQKYFSNTN